MTLEQAIEWVKTRTENDVFVRSELEAAYHALCGGRAAKSDANLWDDDELWLFCSAEVHPICVADVNDALVRLARSGVLKDLSSHACLRAASLLARIRSAIFFRQYDPQMPVSHAEAADAYTRIREGIMHGE